MIVCCPHIPTRHIGSVAQVTERKLRKNTLKVLCLESPKTRMRIAASPAAADTGSNTCAAPSAQPPSGVRVNLHPRGRSRTGCASTRQLLACVRPQAASPAVVQRGQVGQVQGGDIQHHDPGAWTHPPRQGPASRPTDAGAPQRRPGLGRRARAAAHQGIEGGGTEAQPRQAVALRGRRLDRRAFSL